MAPATPQTLTEALGVDSDDVAAAVASFVAAAAEAWPEFGPPAPELAAAIRARQGERVLLEVLQAANAGELWLAAACAAEDATALSIFERRYVRTLDPALKSMGLEPSSVEDVRQQILTRLLTASGDDEPIPLVRYAGEGKLRALVKTVGVRICVDEIRKVRSRPRGAAADALAVDRLIDSGLGPELGAASAEHRSRVKAAFEAAVAALDASDVTLLRLHVIDESTIDDIAALHDVHRATAARWLVRIREKIATETHRVLRQTIAAAKGDRKLQSLLAAVDSELDLSLSRVLRAADSQ